MFHVEQFAGSRPYVSVPGPGEADFPVRKTASAKGVQVSLFLDTPPHRKLFKIFKTNRLGPDLGWDGR